MILHDKFGRQITDLRISITDRCNFRCVYCRSADPENYRDHDEILSWPELDRLARIFLSLGIHKIRITGGEPLVREGVEDYIARLHALGVEDLSMTTNGHLLAERCDRLLAAGLRRVNISLDSLDPGKFERITRTKSFSTVMHSIDAAQKSRLAPAKVNAVLVRGLNDDEVESFAFFARERARIRRTADGKLRTCLFSKDDHDLRFLLRDGANDDEIRDFICANVMEKEEGHRINEPGFVPPSRTMVFIGG